MTRYILDTDHISLQQRAHPAVLRRLQALHDADTLAVTVITVEEQIRGRLEIHPPSRRFGAASGCLRRIAADAAPLCGLAGARLEQAAFERFGELRQLHIRIGSQDLRIAAITLVHGATLVTRNTRDFAQVPGLSIEDWSAP